MTIAALLAIAGFVCYAITPSLGMALARLVLCELMAGSLTWLMLRREHA